MLDPGLQQAILASVDDAFDAQLALTQELVRIPSQRGQEHLAQERVYQALATRGFGMDRFAIDIETIRDHPGFSPVDVDYANAINVVASHTPRETKGRSLILNGHIDVVPTGPLDMWTHGPYDPVMHDGWMYGRGAGDMKSGVVANIFAVDALRRLGLEPAASLHIQSVTEEECTGNGALACLARGYRADAAIITEPTDGTLVRANLGVLWFKVRVRGHPVHVSHAGQGANAIEAAYVLIKALRELEEAMNAEQAAHPYFEDYPHPINLNIGKIAGGDWASSVPSWCEMDCRLGLYPDQLPADIAERIQYTVAQACRAHPFLANNPAEIVWNGFFARGYVLPEGTDAEELLAATHGEVRHGEQLTAAPMPAYLDGRVFMLYDDCPALVYGPQSENVHGFDERVSIESIRQVTKTIALFIARWCGTYQK